MRLKSYLLISCSALLALSLARVLAQTANGGAPAATPDRPAEGKSEPPPSTAAPAGNRPAPKAGKEAATPKVVRWVCTDRICGHCDGECSRRKGHVAVSRRGHCACTPEEGGALDQAIRKAYREHQKGP